MIYVQPHPTQVVSTIEEMIKNSKKNLEHLKAIDKTQENSGSILYRYFVEPHADGRIFYQVIKVFKKTCLVQACTGICLDEWDEGTQSFPIKDVEEAIQARIGLEKLFGNKNKK